MRFNVNAYCGSNVLYFVGLCLIVLIFVLDINVTGIVTSLKMYSLPDKNIPFNIAKQQQEMQQQQVQQQQQQMQQAQQMQQNQQQPPQPLDNISKIKSLVGPLRETLAVTIKTAAQTLNQNSQIDSGSQKAPDIQIPRFDKNLEEFYSICDQIELHLKTSIKCLTQAESSNRYLSLPVIPTRSEPIGMNENSLTYPQFLATVGTQVAYTKEIHETLLAAAQNISPSE